MASGRNFKSNYCPVCGIQVEILNGDVQFSMALHIQSHKSLETIAQEIDQGMRNVNIGPKNAKKSDYTCPECKENIVIVNNDISFSLQLHSQKHKSGRVENKSEDQSSNSSVKSKGSDKKVKADTVPEKVNILDGIFDSMPPGLKLHRGFIFENESGKTLCSICKVKIDSMFSIIEHLKTKSHEDKTITFFTNTLPTELRHVMEFVSFYGSNLCCNLCRNKIDLCSENPYKTIINIITHNSSKGHLQFKTNDESINNSDQASVILKTLANINPVVNTNRHQIECKMQPLFKCKLCDKVILYDQNEKILYHNFDSHFTSKGHIKCAQASSVFEAFNLSQFPGKERHNLVVSKGSIYCTICNCPVEVNLQQLISHVKQAPKRDMTSDTQKLPSETDKAGNMIPLKTLLNSLPPQLRNTACLVENGPGQVKCLVCNTGIPSSIYNLTTHLSGKNHQNKAGMKTSTDQTNKQGSNVLTEELLLLKNLFEEIPISLRKHMQFIQSVNKQKLHCSVCKCDVPALSKYLQDHLEATVHIKSVEIFEFAKFQEKKKKKEANKNVLLNSLVKTDVFIKNCSKYLILNGQQFKCSVCDGNISNANDEKTLKTDIISHVNGQKHKKHLLHVYDKLLDKLELSDPFVKADRQFLQKQQGSIYCTLCSCSTSAATEFESFKTNLLSHLTGGQHKSNKLKVNQSNPAPPSSSTSRSDNLNYSKKMDFLNSIPTRYRDDIAFLKASAVEGFLSCTLCNNVISPLFLREHFEDANHIRNRSVRQPMPTQNETIDQTVAKTMGTLVSLLGNIDKKLSWPAN